MITSICNLQLEQNPVENVTINRVVF